MGKLRLHCCNSAVFKRKPLPWLISPSSATQPPSLTGRQRRLCSLSLLLGLVLFWAPWWLSGKESSLEKEMAARSSTLAWRIPGTAEPGGLLSVGSHRVGHDWCDLAAAEGLSSPDTFYHVFNERVTWPDKLNPKHLLPTRKVKGSLKEALCC